MKNKLILSDPHLPFVLRGFFGAARHLAKKYKCKDIYCTGDIIDNNTTKYHEVDPDSVGALQELNEAKKEIKKWSKVFPKMKIALGNHDALPYRKALTGGISRYWIKEISEVLETPHWEFSRIIKEKDFHLRHGKGMSSKNYAKAHGVNTASGHRHTTSYIEWMMVGGKVVWAMQLGTGLDPESPAAEYGKDNKPQIYDLGLVVDNMPIIVPLEYKKGKVYLNGKYYKD